MTKNKKSYQLHLHISGEDRPGTLAHILRSLVECGCVVLDIRQFVFNGLMNLSLLVESKEEDKLETLQKALGNFSQKENFKINMTPWEPGYRSEAPYKHHLVVTLLGRQLGPVALMELTQTLANMDLNIPSIERLSSGDHHVIEFVVGARQRMDGVEILNALVKFKKEFNVDIAVQEDTLFRRNKRLILLDADMTFLQCEVIDELGKIAGVGEELAGITHAAMNGELDFSKALEQRVALLKGLTTEQLDDLFERIPLTPGAEDLVRILKHLGYKIGIISGGFQYFIDKLKAKYKLDYGYANKLKIKEGVLTGKLEGEILDAKSKGRILTELADQEQLSPAQVVAVGDGANDIHMLARAGLGIAFNAKPIVQQHAHASLNRSNLDLILYFLGINDRDIEELRKASKGKTSGLFEES